MGQQQLLLLVLGIVIVGLAVVAGINAFDENQTKSSQDALTQEAFRLATDAKAFYNKPTQFDGGGNSASALTSAAWDDIGVGAGQLTNDDATATSGNYKTPWGQIKMAGSSGTVKFTLQANSTDNSFGVVTFDPSANEEISFSRTSGDDILQGGGGEETETA